MGEILSKLNDEHYISTDEWKPLHEWVTPNGEMGIYCSDTSLKFGAVEFIVMSEGVILVDQKDARMLDKALKDAELIAKFAGAAKLPVTTALVLD